MRKGISLFIFILVMLLCTSCWDRSEIERKAFILGVAIDKADEPDLIKVTFQIALPEAFGGEGGGDMEGTWQIEVVEENMTAARNALLNKTNWIPTFEHCQVLLMGEDYARDGVQNELDFFFRMTEVRRRMNVAIVMGEASEAFDTTPKTVLASSLFIGEALSENNDKIFEVPDYNYIGRVHESLVLNTSILLNRIIVHEDMIDVSGGAVLKDYKLAGWFSGEEVTGLRFIRGDSNKGIYTVKMPMELGGAVSFVIFEIDSSFRPEFRDDGLIAILDLRVEADVAEIQSGRITSNTADIENVLHTWENRFKQDMEENIRHSYYKGRDFFNADIFRLDEKVRSYYPRYWKEHQDEWEEIFKTIDIEMDIDVNIRRIGQVQY